MSKHPNDNKTVISAAWILGLACLIAAYFSEGIASEATRETPHLSFAENQAELQR